MPFVERINHANEQKKALGDRISREKINSLSLDLFRQLSNKAVASVIADAILFEPQAVQLVARSNGNNIEMEKDLETMSEFDKNKLIRKKIICGMENLLIPNRFNRT